MRTFLATCLWLGAVLLPGAARAQKAPRPPLTGTWIYNVLRSDQVRDRAPDLDVPMGTTGGPPTGGRGEAPGAEAETRPSGVRARPGFGGFGGARLITEVLRPTARLAIVLTQDSVTISDETGRSLRLPTNGKKVEEQIMPGMTLRQTARWQEGDLLLEKRDAASGDKLITIFRFDPVTKRLSQLLKYESGSQSGVAVQLRRVYDRAESPPGGPPPP